MLDVFSWSGLLITSWNTGLGVHLSGETKEVKSVIVAKANIRNQVLIPDFKSISLFEISRWWNQGLFEENDLARNVVLTAIVTWMRPETGRSIPGQSEIPNQGWRLVD